MSQGIKAKLINSQLFDTEYVVPDRETTELYFFQRPLGQSYAHHRTVDKGQSATNVCQAGMLDYPREFFVCGFGLFLQSGLPNGGVEPHDRKQILEGGLFQFRRAADKPMYEIPLNTFNRLLNPLPLPIPSVQAVVDGVKYDYSTAVQRGIVPCSQPNGEEAFKLMPGHAFNVILRWDRELRVSQPVKIMAVIDGFLGLPEDSVQYHLEYASKARTQSA